MAKNIREEVDALGWSPLHLAVDSIAIIYE